MRGLIDLKNKKAQGELKYDIQANSKNMNVKSSILKQQSQKETNNTKTQFKAKGTIYKLPIVCDVETLRALIRKKTVRVVDVRRIEDYKKGHIPTAVSLPLATLLSNDSPEQIVKFPETTHSLKLNQSIYADATYVESVQNNPDKVLVDSRERLNFLSEHIPSAKNIPYTMLGNDNHILRSVDELKRFVENRGISQESEAITYCGSVGTLSGLAFYALKLAGIKNVKLYSKSFKDWKSLGKPKIEFKDANFWDLSAE